ncbi:MAG TPA: hypothetical protein VJB99_01585 [Patescibacteria group bacterium]|nr:hypothetical protein [Patescibacteria group bacterium]
MRSESSRFESLSYPMGILEGHPLFSSPEAFRSALENQGFRQERQEEIGDDCYQLFQVPQGSYRTEIGFPAVDLEDTHFLLRNFPEGNEDGAVVLDHDTPPFSEFISNWKDLLSKKTHAEELDTRLSSLRELFKAQWRVSGQSGKPVAHLSDLSVRPQLSNNESVLLAGAAIRKAFPDLSVQRLFGTSFSIKKNPLAPADHTWLRVSDGRQFALLDLSKSDGMRIYDLWSYQVDLETDPFLFYGIEAMGLGPLHQALCLSSLEGAWVVPTKEGSGKMWYDPEQTRLAQAQGRLVYQFRAQGGKMEFVNGGIVHARRKIDLTAPRLLAPLFDLQRME